MDRTLTPTIIEKLFRIGMYWRILYGFARLLLAVFLFRHLHTPLSDIFYSFMNHEFTRGGSDMLVHLASPFIHHFSLTVTIFLASYFAVWGLIDILLSVSLLHHIRWAFPLSFIILGFFILYELFRFTHTHSSILLGVIGVDVVVFFLIYKEYIKLTLETDASNSLEI